MATLRFDDFPTVRRWRLIGCALHPATTLPPSLEQLELVDVPVFHGAGALLATPAPRLRRLVIGDEHLELAPLLARLSRDTHPALRELVLIDDLADDTLLALAASPLIAQLDVLQVHGPYTDAGLDAVVREAARFDRLARLVLSGGAASGALKREAYHRLPRLELPTRRPSTSWTGW
jgi:hypothetical protein